MTNWFRRTWEQWLTHAIARLPVYERLRVMSGACGSDVTMWAAPKSQAADAQVEVLMRGSLVGVNVVNAVIGARYGSDLGPMSILFEDNLASPSSKGQTE